MRFHYEDSREFGVQNASVLCGIIPYPASIPCSTSTSPSVLFPILSTPSPPYPSLGLKDPSPALLALTPMPHCSIPMEKTHQKKLYYCKFREPLPDSQCSPESVFYFHGSFSVSYSPQCLYFKPSPFFILNTSPPT